jgi:predicted MPP superfamily phosphohydrolase
MDQLESKLKDILSGLQLDIMDQFRQISRSQDPNLKKVVSKTLSDNDAAYIIALGDAHLGSLFCNEKLFSETINFILNTPNVYTILLGDLAETATRTSIGLGIFDEKYHIDKQLDVIVELLKPLADAGKILGMVTGNHEYRIHVMSAVDPSKVIADRLGVEYFGYQAYYSFKVGGQSYSLVAWHGAGASCTKVSQMKAAEKESLRKYCNL